MKTFNKVSLVVIVMVIISSLGLSPSTAAAASQPATFGLGNWRTLDVHQSAYFFDSLMDGGTTYVAVANHQIYPDDGIAVYESTDGGFSYPISHTIGMRLPANAFGTTATLVKFQGKIWLIFTESNQYVRHDNLYFATKDSNGWSAPALFRGTNVGTYQSPNANVVTTATGSRLDLVYTYNTDITYQSTTDGITWTNAQLIAPGVTAGLTVWYDRVGEQWLELEDGFGGQGRTALLITLRDGVWTAPRVLLDYNTTNNPINVKMLTIGAKYYATYCAAPEDFYTGARDVFVASKLITDTYGVWTAVRVTHYLAQTAQGCSLGSANILANGNDLLVSWVKEGTNAGFYNISGTTGSWNTNVQTMSLAPNGFYVNYAGVFSVGNTYFSIFNTYATSGQGFGQELKYANITGFNTNGTPVPTTSATVTLPPSFTASATLTQPPLATFTPCSTATATRTNTPPATITSVPSATVTNSPTTTPTNTTTNTPTSTTTSTATDTPTNTATSTTTVVPSATVTATTTLVVSATASPVLTATFTTTTTPTQLTATPPATTITATNTRVVTRTSTAVPTMVTPTFTSTVVTPTRIPGTPTTTDESEPLVFGCAGTPQPTATNPTGGGNPCQRGYTDLTISNFAYQAIIRLSCLGVINGFPNGNGTYRFEPSTATTRSQFAKMAVLAYGLPIVNPTTPYFQDVTPANVLYPYVESAYRAGIMQGTGTCAGGNCFSPNRAISRSETVVVMVRTQGWTLVNPPVSSFLDVESNYYAYREIHTAYQHNIIAGRPCANQVTTCFYPNNPTRRDEMSKILYGSLQ